MGEKQVLRMAISGDLTDLPDAEAIEDALQAAFVEARDEIVRLQRLHRAAEGMSPLVHNAVDLAVLAGTASAMDDVVAYIHDTVTTWARTNDSEEGDAEHLLAAIGGALLDLASETVATHKLREASFVARIAAFVLDAVQRETGGDDGDEA